MIEWTVKMIFVTYLTKLFRRDFTAEEERKLVAVDCETDQMSVHIEKTLLPGFRLKDLRLQDKSCQPVKTENSSHVTITTPLTDCGTTVEHKEDYFIYKNVVKDGYGAKAIIGRLQVCTWDKMLVRFNWSLH